MKIELLEGALDKAAHYMSGMMAGVCCSGFSSSSKIVT